MSSTLGTRLAPPREKQRPLHANADARFAGRLLLRAADDGYEGGIVTAGVEHFTHHTSSAMILLRGERGQHCALFARAEKLGTRLMNSFSLIAPSSSKSNSSIIAFL